MEVAALTHALAKDYPPERLPTIYHMVTGGGESEGESEGEGHVHLEEVMMAAMAEGDLKERSRKLVESVRGVARSLA